MLLGLVAIAARQIRLRQIELRGGGIQRMRGYNGIEFTDGARVILLGKPKLAEMTM